MMMADATLTSKGQITIPRVVREALGLATGDRISFVDTERGYLIVPATRDLRALRGMFKGRRRRPATVEEMKAAIAEMGSESARVAPLRKAPSRRRAGRS
jgi:AbrB family looped-hinge helix DNA binding protein